MIMEAEDRETRALEIAVAILGPMEKKDIEKANKDGKEILDHYLWLQKAISEYLQSEEKYPAPGLPSLGVF